MYVDGHLMGRYGETHKVSALETLQFSATGIVPNVSTCVTMESKLPGISSMRWVLPETSWGARSITHIWGIAVAMSPS